VFGGPELDPAVQMGFTSTEQTGKIDLLVTVLLTLPRTLLVRVHCRLMLKLKSTGTYRSFSAKPLCCWAPPVSPGA